MLWAEGWSWQGVGIHTGGGGLRHRRNEERGKQAWIYLDGQEVEGGPLGKAFLCSKV